MEIQTTTPSITMTEDDYVHAIVLTDGMVDIRPAKIHIQGPDIHNEIDRFERVMSQLRHFFCYGDAEHHDRLAHNISTGRPTPRAHLPFSYYRTLDQGTIVFTILPNFAERAQLRDPDTPYEFDPDITYLGIHEKAFAQCGYRFMNHEETARAYRKLYRLCERELRACIQT